MVQKQTFTIKINKEQQGKYLNFPFVTPDDVSSIIVEYHYDKTNNGLAVIDLGLKDCDGKFLGWSGSDRSKIEVGEIVSSVGYLTTELQGGKNYYIIAGAYRLPNEGIEVTYDLTFQIKEYAWYKGDLHMHSTASDGVYTREQLGQLAKAKGLDFIAVTDHNNYSENFRLPSNEDVTYIPGVEWTHYNGHVNFLGIDKPFENSFEANSDEEAKKMLDFARASGAIVSINHPFDFFCKYRYSLEDETFLEVYNGPMRIDNVKAVNYFDQQLKKGKKIVVIGGSDFHRDDGITFLASPTTYIYAKSRSVKDLMEAIRRGNVYVVNCPDGITLTMTCGSNTMGETVKLNGGSVDVNIAARGVKDNEFMIAYSNDGIVGKFSPVDGKIDASLKVDSEGYLRIAVGIKMGLIEMLPSALSNALYFE